MEETGLVTPTPGGVADWLVINDSDHWFPCSVGKWGKWLICFSHPSSQTILSQGALASCGVSLAISNYAFDEQSII